MLDIDRLTDVLVAQTMQAVESATTPLIARIAALEIALAKLPVPRDGKDGEPGPQGERGADGVPGAQGAPGERGLQGPPGEPGPQGERGADGALGEAGPQGERGAYGERGLQGPAGPQGERGAEGERGLQGERGERGERGADGFLREAKPYVDGVHYALQVVMHEGSLWQAKCDTGKAPPHADWSCLAAAGEPGRGLTSRGTYDPTLSYFDGDWVALNGGSFVALGDDPGDCPGPGWQLLASPGKRGQKGEDGARGQSGERGLQGAAGPALVAGTLTEDGILRLARDDGEAVEVDLYPVLRKLG